MSLNTFLFRIAAMAVIFFAASVSGVLAISWWGAALIGMGTALAFTFVSERILRGMLMGKIGGSPVAWYSVQLAGETLTFAALLGLYAWLGLAFASGWLAISLGLIAWAVLCQEMLRRLPGMIVASLMIR